MGLPDRAGSSAETAISRRSAAGLEETVWAPSPGAYLTDGAALSHVAHTISDTDSGELFLELEDCSTLEVVLCPARAVVGSGLRSVSPALAS
jgi:hypothetical protein